MGALRGSQPFAVLLCRGRDSPTLPNVKADFEALFHSLNDYWREVSYGQINIDGTRFFEGVNIPKTVAELQNIQRDARIALIMDAFLDLPAPPDFAQFYGVVAVILGAGDIGAELVGRHDFTVRNKTCSLGAFTAGSKHTQEHNTVTHEMGHAFGLEHSYGRTTGEYGDPLDIMSALLGGFDLGRFGTGGPGLNSINMSQFSWLAPSRMVTCPSSSFAPHVVELEALNRPSGNGPSLLRIGKYYVEFRMNDGWDRGISIGNPSVFVRVLENGLSVAEKNAATGDFYFGVGDSFEDGIASMVFRDYVKVTVLDIDVVRRRARLECHYHAAIAGPRPLEPVDLGWFLLTKDGLVLKELLYRVPPKGGPFKEVIAELMLAQAAEEMEDQSIRVSVQRMLLQAALSKLSKQLEHLTSASVSHSNKPPRFE